ncbi:MAG: helix-turn-helix domain-containing protein [Pseudonocardia sp.]
MTGWDGDVPGPGRPRHTGPLRPGAGESRSSSRRRALHDTGLRDDVHRAIAEAVGVRQASLYHHFRTKDDILEALLVSTAQGARLQATMITVSVRFRPDLAGERARLAILSLDETADVLHTPRDFCGAALSAAPQKFFGVRSG